VTGPPPVRLDRDPPPVVARRGLSLLHRPPLAWSLLFGSATAVDLGVRVLTSFAMRGVLWTETALFMATAGAMLALSRRLSATDGKRRRWPAYMAACLVLGALRSCLWAAGEPVYVANMATLLAGLASAGGVWWARRRGGAPGA
jgi:hypothetical protein